MAELLKLLIESVTNLCAEVETLNSHIYYLNYAKDYPDVDSLTEEIRLLREEIKNGGDR